MEKLDLSYHLGTIEDKLEQLYDLWNEIPNELRDGLEKLFIDNQGAGYHIYRAWQNIKDIDHDTDIDTIFENIKD